MIAIAANRIGAGGHYMSATAGELIRKQTGIKVRVIPVASHMARLTPVRSGEALFETVEGTSLYATQLGIMEFATYEWGPQPMQMVWTGLSYLGAMTTKAHDDINTIADLRGKRVAFIVDPAARITQRALIAFGGLTEDDVVVVDVAGYMDQFTALKADKIDAFVSCNTMTVAKLLELEATPAGIKWLHFPADDAEGWKRLHKIAPWMVADSCPDAPGGITKENPLASYCFFFGFAAYEQASPDLIYLVAKTIGDNLDQLREEHATWRFFTIDSALAEGYPHPYHAGTVRYFKEIGRWTDEHEKRNQSLLEVQNKLLDRWQVTIDQAVAEGWKDDKLLEEWTKRQAEISGYTPPTIE